MPLIKSGSKAALGKNIGELVNSGRPQKQAVAIAYRTARDNGAKFAFGGGVGRGLIDSPVPGRTDRLPMKVRPNSYVIPADIVSGLGQGNTAAGAKIFDQIFPLPKSGPYGSAMPKPHMGAGPPHAPRPFSYKADGGETEDTIGIITAGGEYLLDPDTVAEIGGGDMNKGHEILDKMVLKIRKQNIAHQKSLPGPKKD